jgi:recombination protein RecA
MTTLKEVLAKLNKGAAEEDKFKTLSNFEKEAFVRDYISTGSPYLNYRIKKEVGKGGLIKGSYNMIVGGEGSAKTSLSLIAAANCQRTEGKTVVYFDGEGALNQSYFDRFGIDPDLFLPYRGRNLEAMLDAAEAFSTADDVGMIIIDSIPIFVSSAVEARSAEDNTIGIEAKKLTSRMAIIEGNCSRRNICLVGLTFYTLNPGAMGDPRVLKRGEWQKYMSNLTIELTKKDLIFNDKKDPIGHTIDVRIKKSKVQEYDPKNQFQINFYYYEGFNEVDEYARIFLEEGIINQSGAWYKFPDSQGEEQSIQGLNGVIEYLKENTDEFNNLLSRLNS